MDQKENDILLREAPIGQLMARLCIPAVLLMVVMVIYNMADMFFIGWAGDANQTAAISVSTPIFSLMQTLGTLFGSGTCTAIGILLGRKEFSKIHQNSSTCFYASMASGLVFIVLTSVWGEPLAKLLGASADTMTYVLQYTRILSYGAPIIIAASAMFNVLRADGSVKETMIGNLLGTVINLILDPLFISAFHMGVAGAAVATVLGNIGGFAYMLLAVRKKKLYSIYPKDISLKADILGEIVVLGFPTSIATLLISLANIVMNSVLSDYSTKAVAAYGITDKVTMVIAMVAMGICMGFQPVFSYCYGAKDMLRLKNATFKMAVLNLVVSTAFTILILIFQEPLIEIFLKDASVVALGQSFLVAALLSSPTLGLNQLAVTLLQSIMHAGKSTTLACLRKGLLFAPAVLLLSKFGGLRLIPYAIPIADYLSLVVAFAFTWKLYKGWRDTNV